MCEGSASIAVDRDGVEGVCGGCEVLPVGLLTRLRSDRGRSCERVTGVRGNGRRFSKTSSYPPCHHYAFNHLYHYFLTTSSSPLFSLIHPFLTTHFTPFHIINYSHAPYPLCSHRLTKNGNTFYSRQNNTIKDLPRPLSH